MLESNAAAGFSIYWETGIQIWRRKKKIEKNNKRKRDMEAAAFRRSGEEKRVESKSYNKEEIVLEVGNGGTQHENYKKPSSPIQKDLDCIKQELFVTNKEASSLELDSMASSSSRSEQDDQLESARAEMGEVREENGRLKMYLDRIRKDYQNLQMQFYDIVQQEAKKKPSDSDQEIEEAELVSLTLGRFSGHHPKKSILGKGKESFDDDHLNMNLVLGLDSKFQGATDILSNPVPASSFDLEPKDKAASKLIFKTVRSGEDDVSQQIPLKKARVSVRARCDTPTMNDGCQWRKYGQKIAKGNPCPRAYYRCTVAPDCPVRKQVQRCAGDMSILTTTYEGTHNHTLGISATAMASTTSAAASMLLSGSSSSSGHLGPVLDGHGLNFKQFYLPNSSISSSHSHPTITLDLTSTQSSSYPPRYSLTNLNFGSSDQSINAMPWGNGILNYGTSTQPYNRNQSSGTLNLGMENVFQSYGHQQQKKPDTIADATKAITADPSFQSALAAALSSIIGTATSSGGVENFGQPPTAQGINGCASSYFNKVPSTNSQQTASLMFLPSLSFSTSKSASASPGDNRDQPN